MPPPVVMGAQLTCTFGTGPSSLVVIPQGQPVSMEGKFAATIADAIPFVNVLPFPTCLAPANPAGMGKVPVPTPGPCVLPLTGSWVPPIAPTKLINKKPALIVGSQCICSFGGVIMVTNPGSTKEQIS